MPLKIIYLDDEPGICEMFVDNFSSPEIEVTTFCDEELAIKAVNATTPDLVFIDYRLPNTTGDKVASRMRHTIPKALITGDLAVKEVEHFIKVFHKPFDFVLMEGFIQGYIDKKAPR